MEAHEIFAGIPDPRIDRQKLHSLEDILTLTLLATICGVKSWENIALFGKTKRADLLGVVRFQNGVPSHDTIERVFSLIPPEQFSSCFINWTKALSEVKGDLIAIDGKTARRTHRRSDKTDARHIVSAWSSQNSLVLGQYSTLGKGHELAGIRELLSMLDISGSVISIDAIGCQKDIAREITGHQADYILAVKGNQRELHKQVEESFLLQKPADTHHQIDKGHGRIETRDCSVIYQMKWIDDPNQWAELKTIIRIESTREIAGATQQHVRYYISSLKENAEVFNGLIRGHWSIENSLHWTLDMVFREDECRKRKGYSAENFTLVTKMALNLLRRNKQKITTPGKQHLAGWNSQYLLSLLKN